MDEFNWHPVPEGKNKYDIGKTYLNEDHKHNVREAVKKFYEAAEMGDLGAKLYYARIITLPESSKYGTRTQAMTYLIELMDVNAPNAEAIFEEAFDPSSVSDLRIVSDIYYSKQNYSQAYHYLNQLYVKVNGEDQIEVINKLIDSCNAIGKVEEEIKLHEELLSKGVTDRICGCAESYFKIKDLDRAYELFKKAIDLGYRGEGYCGLGKIYESRDDINQSIHYFFKAAGLSNKEGKEKLHHYACDGNDVAMYLYSKIPSKDSPVIWLFLSARKGNNDAMFELMSLSSDDASLLLRNMSTSGLDSYIKVDKFLHPKEWEPEPIEDPDRSSQYWQDLLG